MQTPHQAECLADPSRESWRVRWRVRWKRRNDPAVVRAMFWHGFRHALVVVRLFLVVIVVGLIATVIGEM